VVNPEELGRRPAALMQSKKKAPSKAEKEHIERVKRLECSVCDASLLHPAGGAK
jgi:hypothetical protein